MIRQPQTSQKSYPLNGALFALSWALMAAALPILLFLQNKWLALASFPPTGVATMIAINDQYADGRDMSWLWDVDFASLAAQGVDAVSGTRAWDMALRLEHDEVPVAWVEEDLDQALRGFRARTSGRPRRIYCTYTAMLSLRKALAEVTEVEEIW